MVQIGVFHLVSLQYLLLLEKLDAVVDQCMCLDMQFFWFESHDVHRFTTYFFLSLHCKCVRVMHRSSSYTSCALVKQTLRFCKCLLIHLFSRVQINVSDGSMECLQEKCLYCILLHQANVQSSFQSLQNHLSGTSRVGFHDN